MSNALSPDLIPEPSKGIIMDPLASSPEPVAAKPKRKAWTQLEIVELVGAFHRGDPGWTSEHHSQDEANTKLIELGLVAKPAKIGLFADVKANIDDDVADLGKLP